MGSDAMIFDFLIVGAGMAGASLAYELAEQGRVCLLEAEEQAGVHATGRSAALFAPSYGGSAVRAMTRASQSFLTAPPEGFCDVPLVESRGCLYLARDDQRAELGDMTRDLIASGGRVKQIGKAGALAMIPLLKDEYIADAIYDPDAMDLDVDALHRGFLRGARARGAKLLMQSRLAQAQWDGAWSVAVRDGSVTAPILINAAGAWVDEVAAICGAHPLGMRTLRRTAVLVDPPQGAGTSHWPAVFDVSEQFYFKPDAGKLLLSPADETPDEPGDAQPEMLDIAIAVDRVQAALDIEVRRVSHSWAGLRTFAPDRVPVVGFDPDVPGFFWCAGQGGYGIQTAPAMARLASALARCEPIPSDIVHEGVTAGEISPGRLARPASARTPIPGLHFNRSTEPTA